MDPLFLQRIVGLIGVTTVVASTVACSSSESTSSRGDGGPAPGGASNGGASNGGASSGGASNGGANNGGGISGGAAGTGTGGAITNPCPADPPADASTCTTGSCFYENCGTFGRVSAECTNAKWVVQKASCADIECGINHCTAGQACMTRSGGAEIVDCTANHCDGLVRCDCIDGCFAGCSITSTTTSGVAVSCNTCPGGGCP